jgi:nucleotide-binding universal stress UspA family protein
MIELRRILCPTDLSELSARALRHAIALASWYEAEIRLVHVEHQLVAHRAAPGFPAWTALDPSIRHLLLKQLEAFAEPARRAGVRVSLDVHAGVVGTEVLAEASALPADLIVMATHGRSGVQRLMLGSVTEHVLHKAACPVLTVGPAAEQTPPSDPHHYARILCAVDASPASLSALRYALALAQEAAASLTLLRVVEWSPLEVHKGYDEVDMGPLRDELLRQATERLRASVPDDARNWCRVQESVAFGSPHAEILRAAEQTGAQLVVIGAHGKGVGHLLFGSNTQRVVRAAACPVLTVPLTSVAERIAAPDVTGAELAATRA